MIHQLANWEDFVARFRKLPVQQPNQPNDLFRHNGRWVVGDFGLVTFEGKEARTVVGERLGPLFFMAPEMLNNSQPQDGRPADVYSLAETIWVLVSGQRCPPQNQLTRTIPALTMSSLVRDPRAALLDHLLEQCTHPTPSERPPMTLVAQN